MSALQDVLTRFAGRINANGQVRRVAQHWRMTLYVQPSDDDACWRLRMAQGVVTGVELAWPPEHDVLLLRASAQVLESVFDGRQHPLNAYNQGLLEVYGPHAEQICLDTLTLLLWGA